MYMLIVEITWVSTDNSHRLCSWYECVRIGLLSLDLVALFLDGKIMVCSVWVEQKRKKKPKQNKTRSGINPLHFSAIDNTWGSLV